MSETTESVKLVPGVCPKCGGKLEVDPTQEAAVCQYCGTPFIVDKAINQYNVQNAHIDHVDKVTVDLKGGMDSFFGFVEHERDKGREEKRINKQIDAENQRAFMQNGWKMFAIMFAAMVVLFVLGNLFGFFK